MLGDRDYRKIIKDAIDSVGQELEVKIDAKDFKTVHLGEVTQCLRRSYYDRTDPVDVERKGFNDLLSGLLKKLHYNTDPLEFEVGKLKLKAQPDMILDEAVIIFRSADEEIDAPVASDLLYINACMWVFNKIDGIIIYFTGDRKEISFSITKNKKMFEETVRRVRVLNDLLNTQRIPILEPSQDCLGCQYYSRCFISKKEGRSIELKDLLGLGKN